MNPAEAVSEIIFIRTTEVVEQFANWLYVTAPSVLIQTHSAWVIPAIQSVHIVAIGISVGSMLMIDLRVLGLAGRDQTLAKQQTGSAPGCQGLWLSCS